MCLRACMCFWKVCLWWWEDDCVCCCEGDYDKSNQTSNRLGTCTVIMCTNNACACMQVCVFGRCICGDRKMIVWLHFVFCDGLERMIVCVVVKVIMIAPIKHPIAFVPVLLLTDTIHCYLLFIVPFKSVLLKLGIAWGRYPNFLCLMWLSSGIHLSHNPFYFLIVQCLS